jgi:hypothetical protein
MSDTAKKARAAMKERAQRRAAPEKGDIDASGWREPTMNTSQKTGMLPISKRAFKRGGKVNLKAEGKGAMKHAGKKPRASGGMTVDDYINRNDKIANEKRGYAHVGGYKKGGKAHTDEAMDKKLIKTMVSKKALKKADGGQTVLRAGKGDYAGKFAPDMSERDAAAIMAAEKAKAAREREFEALQGRKKGGRVHKDIGGFLKGIGKTAGKLAEYGPLGGFGGILPSAQDTLKNALSPNGGKKAGGKVEHAKGCKCKACGGRTAKKDGGKTDSDPDDQFKHPYFGDVRQYEGKKWDEGKEKWVDKKGRTGRKSGGRTAKKGGGDLGVGNPFEGKYGDALDMGAQFLSPAYAIARGKLPGMLGMLTGALAKKNGGKAGKANYTGGTRPTGGRIAKYNGGGMSSEHSKGEPAERMMEFVKGISTGEGPIGERVSAMMSKFGKGPAAAGAAGAAPAASGAMSATPYTQPAMKKSGGRTARKSGGRTKGKTNIHININTAPKPEEKLPMLPPGMMQNKPMPVPPPPAAMPPAGMGAPPAGGGIPPGLGVPPAAMGPMMGRKAGGRVYRSYKDMDAGAGGGLGRLEKSEIQKRKR